MNEKLLVAVLKLYAIIARLDGYSESDKEIARQFLSDHVKDTALERYLQLFDSFAKSPDGGLQETADICASVNSELTFKQKILILTFLSQLILDDGIIEVSEENHIKKVCEGLNLDFNHFLNMKQLMLAGTIEDVEFAEKFLVINGKDNPESKLPLLYRESLESELMLFSVDGLDLFIFKCFSNENLLVVNGQLIVTNRLYPFGIGSVIRGEKIKPIYFSEAESRFQKNKRSEHVLFSANEVNYYHKNGAQGLFNINLQEESGRLIAIMGSSGSGKSTLLNVLNGIYAPQSGSVTINGIDIHKQAKKVEGLIGYVPQDDLLMGDLTVFENLFFAAGLCFRNETKEALTKLVNKTLNNLGISEISNLKVGDELNKSISGGQRKRVNIGLELLRQPTILFADEPTSGLSSRDSENIMDLLRELASQGKLIFVVIHQPSSDIFKMFDKLILLDKGGHLIYYDNPVEAIHYFKTLTLQHHGGLGECDSCGNVNPEQIFNIIETPLLDENGLQTKTRRFSPERWEKSFREHFKGLKKKPVPNPLDRVMKVASVLTQFLIFFKRDFLCKIRNTQYMNVALLQSPFLALVLGSIVRYYDQDKIAGSGGAYLYSENMNIPTFIFMSVIVALFTGLSISSEEIIKDARIRKRESFLHLNRHSYLLSKVFLLFLFSTLQTILFVLVGNRIVGIYDMNWTYILVLFSVTCFANLLGLNISSTFNNIVTIYIMIPVLLIPQLVMGGLVVRFSEINPWLGNKTARVPVIGDVMTSRWAFEALAVSQFKDNPLEKRFYLLDKLKSNADYTSSYWIPTMIAKVDMVKEWMARKDTSNNRELVATLHLIRRELEKENRRNPRLPFINTGATNPDWVNREVIDSVQKHLETLKLFYNKISTAASKRNDVIITAELKKENGKENFENLVNTYQNLQLSRLVKNNQGFVDNAIAEYHEELIQLRDPIYQDPEPQSWFDYRTKFYVPEKNLLGLRVSTLTFNVLVIWLFTFFLYVTLYFNVFRKILHYFERLRRKNIIRKPSFKT